MSDNKNMALTPLDGLRSELPQLKALLALNAKPNTDVEAMALQELEYLRLQALTKTEIMQCAPSSIVLAVKAVLKQNLSLDPHAGLVYLKTRSVNVGTAEKANWQRVLEIIPTANGIISVARQLGRLLDIKNPVVKKDMNGKVIGVEVEILVPSYGAPRWEKREFDESDFERWRRASDKENGRGKEGGGAPKYKFANPNYTNWKGGIDPEFARAKAIRHGVKKLGVNPNESKMDSIVMNEPVHMKDVKIDTEKDMQTTADEGFAAHEVVETKTAAPAQPETATATAPEADAPAPTVFDSPAFQMPSSDDL